MKDESAADHYSNEQATFGDRLAAAREEMGLSQQHLARRIGVRTSTVERWEDDRSEPRANRLQMLAGVLNVSLIWLMTGEGEGVAVEDDEEEEDLLGAGAVEVLKELRQIRADQRRLSERTGRLEKRLRAVLLQ